MVIRSRRVAKVIRQGTLPLLASVAIAVACGKKDSGSGDAKPPSVPQGTATATATATATSTATPEPANTPIFEPVSTPVATPSLVSLTGFTSVGLGSYFSCATTSGGGVKCWGYNAVGQLGNNSDVSRFTAVGVSGLTSGVSSVAAGNSHACALTTAGAVKCWGKNTEGQLGDNSTTNRSTPVDVSGLSSGVSKVAAGYEHTCIITSAGAVKCWGSNATGQLGDNTTTSRLTPTAVSGLSSGVTSLALGSRHSCALTAAGGVKCWGDGVYNQLGNGTQTSSNVPVDVSGLTSGVLAISSLSYHTCALTAGGAVKCWGPNSNGQLGNSTVNDSSSPVDVTGLSSGVTAIAVGYSHSCALAGGIVKCWGENSSLQLADASVTMSSAPIPVPGTSTGNTALWAGNDHACAKTSTGTLKCWGSNYYGEQGPNKATVGILPTDVSAFSSGVTAISAKTYSTCFLTTAGAVKCTGANGDGQLGDNTKINRYEPVQTSGLTSGVSAIALSNSHACAIIASGGTIKCWGSNGSAQLGDNSTTSHITPADVNSVTNATALALGYYHSCALISGGTVKCWGGNDHGEVGDNSTTRRNVATAVSGLSGVTAIATGDNHNCVLASGGVKCWGYNDKGQLGDASTTQRLIPTDVTGLTSGVTSIAVGQSHNCALLNSGGVKCWGYNVGGQLGDNSTTDRNTPVDVSGLTSGVSKIFAGALHTCAVLNTGVVKCWGRNYSGQLGDGKDSGVVSIPQDVPGLTSGIGALSGGYSHTCSLSTTGGVKCWGANGLGAFGIGARVPENALVMSE